MRHQSQNNDARQTIRWRKRVWLILMGVALLAIAAGLLWTVASRWDTRSADERLAEIEAARAIPDAENAAVIYGELLQNATATSLSDSVPESLIPEVFGRARREPWLSQDHPELAAWVREHQFIIDRLLETARFEKCRFPISIDIVDTSVVSRTTSVHQWASLLSIAANNDLAEGRIEAALGKWRCLLQMGNHLRQQPLLFDHFVATSPEELAMESMARFIVNGDATESHVQEIEAMQLSTKGTWAEHLRAIRSIEDLRARKVIEPFGPLGRLQYHFTSWRMKRAINSATGRMPNRSPLDDAGSLYNRQIAAARGVRILIALRRYQNATGRWPASLDEIRATLPTEVLIDPLNGGAFVYRPAADTFRLYSRGKNKLDEGGKWDPDAGPDDWPIWPPRRGNPGRSRKMLRADSRTGR